jgi:hypothetical protein
MAPDCLPKTSNTRTVGGAGQGPAEYVALTRSKYRKHFCEQVVKTAEEELKYFKTDNSWIAVLEESVRCIPPAKQRKLMSMPSRIPMIGWLTFPASTESSFNLFRS